jgi:hypothetical protein
MRTFSLSLLFPMMALLSSINADISSCTLVLDTDDQLQAAGYHWNYFATFKNQTFSPNDNPSLQLFTVIRSYDESQALSNLVLVPKGRTSSNQTFFMNAGALQDIKTGDIKAAAFRVRVYLKNSFEEGGVIPNYLLQSSSSCQGQVKGSDFIADDVVGIELFQLIKDVA